MFKPYLLTVTTLIAILFFVTLPTVSTPNRSSATVVENTIATTDVPVTSSPTVPAAPTANAAQEIPYPVSLSIPAISLKDAIVPVGLDKNGAMDVPSGKTQNVGWYQNGTLPGDRGSAVLDAHVFAAFAKLHDVSVGDDIYVTMSSGAVVHFRVEDAKTYALADVPADTLFNRNDQSRLNLITCAGSLTPDHATYDHRFVAYAVLAQ